MKTTKKIVGLIIGAALLIGTLIPFTVSADTLPPANEPGSESQISDYHETYDPSDVETDITQIYTREYADGGVLVSKQITPTDSENIFDITLTVKTKKQVQEVFRPADAATVLILDTSTSMKADDITEMETAVNAFLAKFADYKENGTYPDAVKPVRYVALVTFNKNVKSYTWVDIAGMTNPTVKGLFGKDVLKTYACTNTHGGLYAGNELLKSDVIADVNPDNVFAVLMTDGQPNTITVEANLNTGIGYCYDWADSGENKAANAQAWRDESAIPNWESDPRFASENSKYEGQGDPNLYAAARADMVADEIKENSAGLYVIGYGEKITEVLRAQDQGIDYVILADDFDTSRKTIGGKVLQQCGEWLENDIASPEADDTKYYYRADASTLQTTFGAISSSITTTAKAWQVSDPMGPDIQLLGVYDEQGDLVYEDVSALGIELDEENDGTQKITWDLTAFPYTVSQDGTEYTYSIKYQVRLNTLAEGFSVDNIYKTNGRTMVSYSIETEVDGSTEVEFGDADFNIPSVKGYEEREQQEPVNISFKKVSGETEEELLLVGAEFELTTEDDPNWKMTVKDSDDGANDGLIALTNIPSGHDYYLSEIKAPNGYAKLTKPYTLEVHYGEILVKDENGNELTDEEVANLQIENMYYNLPVEKVWTPGTTPAPVTVTLKTNKLVDGQQREGTVSLSSSNDWSGLFGDDDNFEGQLIEDEDYSEYITENVPDGITYTVTKGEDGVYTVKNMVAIDVMVEKTWSQTSNRPSSITLTLYGNGEQIGEPQTVSSSNGWKHTFENLRKYDDNGLPIEYTVEEGAVTDWYPTYTRTTENNGDVTYGIYNTYSTGFNIPVVKEWNDNNNQDGMREPVTITLQRRKGTSGSWSDQQSVTLSAENNWTHTFADLAKNSGSGSSNVYYYRISEKSVPKGYTASYSTNNSGNGVRDNTTNKTLTVTNTHKPETTKVTAYKVWSDDNNQAETRPDSLDLTLYQTVNGVTSSVDADPAISKNGNTWTYSYTNLPLKEGGQLISYSVDEENIPDNYEKKVSEDGWTITNTYVPETVEFSVAKIWADNNNQDGKRPTELELTLYKNVAGVESIVDDVEPTVDKNSQSGNQWTYTYTDLPKYEGGQLITYSAKETSVPDGYTMQELEGGTIISNTHIPEITDVTVTKVWEDNNNQDGKRTAVTFVLNTGAEITLDGTADDNGETEPWVAKWTNLPKYSNGQEITYSVTEKETPEGYTISYGEGKTSAVNGGTITNTHTPETTDVTVTKVWEDNNNQDGKRTAVTFVLNTGAEITLDGTADDNGETEPWVAKWTNLPKYSNGQEITYSVTEKETPEGYTISYGEGKTSAVDGGTIINSHTPEKIRFVVTKVWDDNDDQDGKRTAVTFVLSNGDEVTLDGIPDSNDGEGCPWVAEWEDLPKYKEGQEITYSVTEKETPEGYTISYGAGKTSAVDGGTITNTHTPETTDVTVTKVWEDNNDQDGKRTAVTFKLSNGDEITLDGTADDNGETEPWVAKWEDLPKYNNGQEITYSVTENAVPEGYTISYGEGKTSAVDGGTITNTHTPATKEVTVSKKWEDNNDQDGKRPETLELTLYKMVDGKEDSLDSQPTIDMTGDNGNTWTYSFKDLPIYENGKFITYIVKENNAPEGYTKSYGEGKTSAVDGGTITNTHTPETIDVTVTKVWEDNNDQDGKRTAVTFVLSNGDEITLDGTADDNGETEPWVAKWEDLPKYSNGQEITYSVTEKETPEGYTISYGAGKTSAVDGGTITNTHTPETIDVTVTKVWEDNNNQDGKRTAVTFKLSNGDEITLDGTADDNGEATPWVAKWTNLPKYKEGQEITYSVTENAAPEGYTISYGAGNTSAANGGTITNTHTPATTEIILTKVWDDDSDRDQVRPEKITISVYGMYEDERNLEETARDKFWVEDIDVEDDGDNDHNTWVLNVTGLDQYKDGRQLYYVADEKSDLMPTGYQQVTDGEDSYDCTVKNFYDPEKTSIDLTKVWDDSGNRDRQRPTSVTFVLYGQVEEETPFFVQNVELTGGVTSETWAKTVYNLPLNENGKPIRYFVSEADTDDPYEITEITDTSVTNSYTAETTNITVTKNWDDDGNRDGKRPDAVTFEIYGQIPGEDPFFVQTVDVTGAVDGDSWTATINGLDKNKDGVEITYFAKESTSYAGYEKIAESGLTVTNKHTPELTDITITKAWEDADDQDGKRPGFVKLTLYKIVNGNKSEVESVTMDGDGNEWSYTFDDLFVYENGYEIEYVAEEKEENVPEDYTGSWAGLTVTNTHVPETVDIEITKIWDDGDDKDDLRPADVTLTLYKTVGDVTEEVTTHTFTTKENRSSYVFEGLPKYEHAQEIKYFVDEELVPEGYKKSVSEDGFTVTNYHKPKNTDGPGTGDHANMGLWMALLAVSFATVISLGAFLFFKKRKN